MSKSRYMNPIVGDIIDLQLLIYNSNNLANAQSIDKVDIYKLDPTQCSDCNADGRVLVETITDITNTTAGDYSISLQTISPQYTIGKYLDVWTVVFKENDSPATVENHFEIFPDLFYTSNFPMVYGFIWNVSPNRIRVGSNKFIAIKITGNIPRATDLERYYTNLIISSNLKIYMEKVCDPCGDNCEEDLIIDGDDVTIRDKCFAFYRLDTTEDNELGLDVGLFNVWFTLEIQGNIEVSEKINIQIY